MYLYESHIGGIYLSPYELEPETLFCEVCNKSDRFLGYHPEMNIKIAWEFIKNKYKINASMISRLQYIYPELCRRFDVPIDFKTNKNGECFLSKNEILNRLNNF